MRYAPSHSNDTALTADSLFSTSENTDLLAYVALHSLPASKANGMQAVESCNLTLDPDTGWISTMVRPFVAGSGVPSLATLKRSVGGSVLASFKRR